VLYIDSETKLPELLMAMTRPEQCPVLSAHPSSVQVERDAFFIAVKDIDEITVCKEDAAL